MPLHLIKLCVGAESIRDMEEWIAEKLAAKRASGAALEQTHQTRMTPKRAAELLDGGSLYWVIKGQISARQAIVDIRPFTDAQGISRCHIVLTPAMIPVAPRPRRPFQGWRYLPEADAPPDLSEIRGKTGQMPEGLRRELSELGLL